ncbi:MAG: YegS/Rv2252/BmrU family lipid kinase [Clostridium sp.]|nr:YegS/Rv2252/BmrU family lipid kinase [Clostridium sp.]
MKRALFVVNPKSGKANIRNSLLGITDILTKSDYLTSVYITQKAKDATDIILKTGMEYDLLVCAGGDGTLDEVVGGIMRLDKKIPIGYVPSGSTNDFAKSMGISSDNLEAAQTIVKGTPFLCDVGLFNDSYFTYVAAFGAFTEVSYSTPQQTKNVLGHLAYILEGAKSLASIQSYPICVKYKEEETGEELEIKDEIILGMVTNSITVGGMKRYKEEQVAFDDGLFEVILIRNPKNMIELNAILGSLLLNDMNSEYIYYFKTENLKFESESEINWTLDGEFGGSLKEAEITNIKQGFSIYRNMGIQE